MLSLPVGVACVLVYWYLRECSTAFGTSVRLIWWCGFLPSYPEDLKPREGRARLLLELDFF
jgi:hypothetical protein